MKQHYIRIIQSEIYKSIKLKELYIFILSPSLVIFLIFYRWISKDISTFNALAFGYKEKNPWEFIYQSIFMFNPFLFTLFIVFYIYINLDLEHRGKIWKYYFSLPHTKSVFLIKQFVYSIVCFIMFLFSFCLIVLMNNILIFLNTELPLSSSSQLLDYLFIIHLKLFLASLPIISFQVWFNSIFQKRILLNLLIPIISWLSFTKFLPHNNLIGTFDDCFSFDRKKITFVEHFNIFSNLDAFNIILFIMLNLVGYYILTPKLIQKLS